MMIWRKINMFSSDVTTNLIISLLLLFGWIALMCSFMKEKKHRIIFTVSVLVFTAVMTIIIMSKYALLLLFIGIPLTFIDWGTKMFPIRR